MPAAPYDTVRASSLAETTEPLRWLVEGLFIQGGAVIVGGAPKAKKSYLTLELAMAVASGTPCAGRYRTLSQGPVLLLPAEDPPALVLARLQALARWRRVDLARVPIDVIVGQRVLLPEGLDRLAANLAQLRPRMVVLDPLIRLHRADENRASEMSVILDGLRVLARDYDATILVVHHARKAGGGGSPGLGLRGSSDLSAFADVNVFVRKVGKDRMELRVEHRAAASPDPVMLKLSVRGDEQSAEFSVVDIEENPLEERVLELLLDADEPLSSRQLRERLGIRNQALADIMQALDSAGRVCRRGRDGWTAGRG